MLAGFGCDAVQGFLISPPCGPAQLIELLAGDRWPRRVLVPASV